MNWLLIIPALLISFSYPQKNAFTGVGKEISSGNFQILTPPEYPGGQKAFHKYLTENLKWPEGADKSIQGMVTVSFFVEADGRLSDFQIVKSMSPKFDAEALKIMANSRRWIPAMRNNRPIKSKTSESIKFYLTE
ncbi:energy transducer TonB [Mucilaginibacter sp.]|uniref:energy transducer TonB n=1 Tax=Mucilaginibacter sp. TaxID=1882438 RepID=UPI003D0C6EF8